MTPLKRVEPETHWIDFPTPHVPNSKLPILVYRNALGDTSPENVISTIEPNRWFKGGQWKTSKTPHFHSIAHECYGIIKGSTTYILGKAPLDPTLDDHGRPHGMELRVGVGDVLVLPAGVSHASIESDGDYEFVGFYPGKEKVKGPRYDMNYCKQSPEKTKELADKCAAVPMPGLDPLYGEDGPLPRLWKQAAAHQRQSRL